MVNLSKNIQLILNLIRKIHTTPPRCINPPSVCPKPPSGQKPPCGWLNLEAEKRLAVQTKIKQQKLEQKERAKDPKNLKCCHTIKMPICKPRARASCLDVEEDRSCKKWLAPAPSFSECLCVRKFFPKKCAECGISWPPNVCDKRKKLVNTQTCVKLPPGIKLKCADRHRPKPPVVPWGELDRCKGSTSCENPDNVFRADDESPPKVWKKLVPVFPSLNPRQTPKGW